MTQKFGRTERLTIEPNDGTAPIIVQLPFTVNFTVERHKMASLNRASFEIYNLAPETRNRIFQDRYDLGNLRTITFEIGYGQLYRVYTGRIFEASSAREGTNIVTRIESLDGQYDINSAITSQTLVAGTKVQDLFKILIAQFPNLKLGAVGKWDGKFNRAVALNGGVWGLIQQYCGGLAYIDNGQVYVLQQNEIPASAQTINIDNSSGLLQTPRRDDSYINITTLMEPSINIGDQVNFHSTVTPEYNGQYTVAGIRHSGTISAAVNGKAYSVLSLFHQGRFGPVEKV